MAHPAGIGAGRVAVRLEMISEQPPPVRGAGLEMHGMPERRDRFMPKARFAARNRELEMHGSRPRLLARQGLKDFERGRCAPTTAMRGPENEPSDRMGGTDVQNFSRLLRREVRIVL
jgi:hypothetical protein